jgi:CheY-like chemotaxis protein
LIVPRGTLARSLKENLLNTLMATDSATVLLVDDYPDTLEMWTLYLRSHGYSVFTADNGIDALAMARTAHPSLVILDLDLPGISGYEVARRLRGGEETASIPLIAATGYSADQQLDEAKDCGFTTILVKPCDPEGLVRAIENVLGASPDSASAQ